MVPASFFLKPRWSLRHMSGAPSQFGNLLKLMRWAIGPLRTSIEPETLQRALADRAILLNPYSANAYITRGYILHWLYRRGDAREDVKKALEFNPNQSDGRIGHTMMQTGRAQEALDFFQNALRYDPFPPSIHLSWQGTASTCSADLRKLSHAEARI